MQKPGLTHKLFFVGLVLFSVFFMRCSNENQGDAALYDIDSVIKSQIPYFIRHGAEIRKKAVLNGVEKITTIYPKDSVDWNEELAIFLELDVINKPINRRTYKVENVADKESNLRLKAFYATEDLPVRFLKVYYDKSLRKIRKIEAEYHESNSLYTSTRLLTMEFENIADTTILTSYSVEGGQKMFLDDSVHYTIDAGIAQKK